MLDPVDHPGGGSGLRNQGRLMHRLHLGDVEGGVDLQGGGQVEMNSHWIHHPVPLKGAHKAQRQLPCLDLKQKIPRGQPDLLTRSVGRSWRPVMVCLSLGM